ncbi:MAG TPA: hypothetical protein V6D05_08640 [Stenomitos sp.]
MRHAWLMVALVLAGCNLDWNGWRPEAPASPSPAPGSPPHLYGRPLELVRETRTIATASGSMAAAAQVIRASAIPGVAQVDANDCGPAAIATLLGFYGLKPEGDSDPLRAVKTAMPPQQWGTRIEEARDYLNRTGYLHAEAYRDGELSGVMDIVRDGRPVPVVVTLDGNLTRMHWLLVVGLAVTPTRERYVLCKNPSDSDPLGFSAYSESSFQACWENSPLRSQWWSSLMAGVTDTNAASYRRPYLDVGALARP